MVSAIACFVALLVAVAAQEVQFDNPIDKLVLLQRHAEAKINTTKARAHLAATYSRVQRNRIKEGRQLQIMGEDTVRRATAVDSVVDSLPGMFQDAELLNRRKQFLGKAIASGRKTVDAGKKMASGPTSELFEASSVLSIKAIVADAIKEETLALREQSELDQEVDACYEGGVITDHFLKPARDVWHQYYGKTVSSALVKSEAALASAAGGPGISLLELGSLGISEISDETVLALQQELDDVDQALRLEEEMMLDVASFATNTCQEYKDQSHFTKVPILSRTIHHNLNKCAETYGKVAEIGAEAEF